VFSTFGSPSFVCLEIQDMSGRLAVGAVGSEGGERSAGEEGSCFFSFESIRLEWRRGNWKSSWEASGDLIGIKLDTRLGDLILVGDFAEPGERGGMSTIAGLLCKTILKDDSVGVKTSGDLFGEGVSFAGDKDLALRTAGDAVLILCVAGSGGGLVIRSGKGGLATTGLLGKRLDEDIGTLKLGVDGE